VDFEIKGFGPPGAPHLTHPEPVFGFGFGVWGLEFQFRGLGSEV